MTQLPTDPLTPASKSQTIVVGVASLITSTAFFIFAALTIQMTSASGRISLPPVIFLIALMLIIGVGFLSVAVVIFRRQEKRGPYLLGSVTLYLVGAFLFVMPIATAGAMMLTQSYQDSWLLLKVLPLSSLGLLAIRLAHIRRKKQCTSM